MADKCRFLFLAIHLPICVLPVAEVVGDEVVGREPICRTDSLVEQACHLLVKLVGCCVGQVSEMSSGEGLAESEVHASFLLGDASQDAVQVLAWLFRVGTSAALVKLDSLQHVARLPFVRDGDRHDVQFGK